MKKIVIITTLVALLTSCNTFKQTTSTASQSSDSSSTEISSSIAHIKEDNISVKRDNGTYQKITITNNNLKPISVAGIDLPMNGTLTLENGTYNRDNTEETHKDEYSSWNVYHHINITTHKYLTTTTTERSRGAWLPMLLLALGGGLIFLASRVPFLVTLILNLVNLVISKFKNNKNKTNDKSKKPD